MAKEQYQSEISKRLMKGSFKSKVKIVYYKSRQKERKTHSESYTLSRAKDDTSSDWS